MCEEDFKTKITLNGLYESIVNAIEKIIGEQPYPAFLLMSALVEFMGKCKAKRADFDESGHSKEDFTSIIKLNAFNDYKILGEKYTDDLYSVLRCGLIHSMAPKEGIKLTKNKNDLSKKIIGAVDFFNSIKKGWEELMEEKDFKNYVNGSHVLLVSDEDGQSVSGHTKTIK